MSKDSYTVEVAPQPAAAKKESEPSVSYTVLPGEQKGKEGEEKEKKPVSVPDVKSKADEKEQARMQAMIGNMKENENTAAIRDLKKGETYELASLKDPKLEKDLKNIGPAYVSNCKGATVTLNKRTVKVLIEGCDDCTIVINGDILTRTVEMWKCNRSKLVLNTECKTAQLDICDQIDVTYQKRSMFGAIVWSALDKATFTIGGQAGDDSKASASAAAGSDAKAKAKEEKPLVLITGHEEVKKQLPDTAKMTDQFIVRLQEKEGAETTLLQERCIRLKNGHLSTEREALEWDKRNEVARDRFVNSFLKEAGVTLNKEKVKKVPRNDPCPCGSKKKYKKCCENKKELTGVAGSKKHMI